MTAALQLPRYTSHKVVHAAKITGFRANGELDMPDLLLGEVGGVVTLLPDWHARHRPHVGGYYVVYEDGYTSFSPAEAFEKGYTRTPETFQDRVRVERAELSDKLSKLYAFFQTATFDGLPEAERSRLRSQARFMDGYAAVLEERIAAFTE